MKYFSFYLTATVGRTFIKAEDHDEACRLLDEADGKDTANVRTEFYDENEDIHTIERDDIEEVEAEDLEFAKAQFGDEE